MRNEILRAIDKNGRITPDELAIMLGYDVDAVKKEIQEMEEEHIICGYPTLINWDKTDCERVTAWIEVKVAPQRGLGFDKIAERIYKFAVPRTASAMPTRTGVATSLRPGYGCHPATSLASSPAGN